MRVQFTFKALVVGHTSNEGKDGKTYYNLALVIDGSAGNVGCSEAVFKSAALMKENTFVGCYDFRWNRFWIESVA